MPDIKYDVLLRKLREQDVGASGDFVEKSGDTMTGSLNMSLNQILNFRIDNLAALPAAGNKGRLIYFTIDDHIYLDQG